MDIKILQQPDDVTCGPTSLQAVYNHLGYKISLKQLISEIEFLEDGGTLGVFLGIDALKRGFKVTIHSYNLTLLDPTWSERLTSALSTWAEPWHFLTCVQPCSKSTSRKACPFCADFRQPTCTAACANSPARTTVPYLMTFTASPWGTLWSFTVSTTRNSLWSPTPTAPTRCTRNLTTRSISLD